MKRLLQLILPIVAVLIPGLALAEAPSLQVTPLKYESTMLGPDVRDGFVDVSNPTDTALNIQASVQGFRQYDLAGDLKFFSSKAITNGIKLGLTSFSLGPQQAVRITFSVDPSLLPQGGDYAVIFFRTVPPPQSANTSFVAESANVGTLLILQNGPADQHIGRITQYNVPFLQLGNGISGTAQYQNTNHSTAPVAFAPALVSKVFPWGHGLSLTGPYVLPGSTRQFTVNRAGSYFGLLPVSLVDSASGIATTRWVFAATGTYAFLLVYLLALILVWVFSRVLRRLPLVPRSLKRWLTKPAALPHRTVDGLAPKK